MIKLFVGLGNPGAEYDHTRHNAGFWWLDALAAECKTRLVVDRSYWAQMARCSVQGNTVWLLAPQTFMNASGKSVAALACFFKIAPNEILVAHDELDIAPGEAKLKLGGSHAGHNGLRDIHAQLGTDAYWRLRLGIGHPGNKAEVVHWVLKKPSSDDRIAIDQSIARSLKALPHLLAGEMDRATMLIHTNKPPRPKPPRPPTTPEATPQNPTKTAKDMTPPTAQSVAPQPAVQMTPQMSDNAGSVTALRT
jgi:PTH1 family peptidyl-tRNA hydrolase